MRRLALIASLILCMGLNAMFAQTTTITGNVTDSDAGDPVPGVSVVVRGTTIGTVTDIDGNYSLSVPDDATNLLFSFVGMKTQDIVIGGRTAVNVVMESDAIGVDEVVVTALGISREKKSLGYASQGVKSDELTSANNANAVEALSGKVAGVQISGANFAGSKNVLIRGASSLTGNNQPLYVIDGVPMDNQNFNSTSTQTGGGGVDYGSMINDINSNDIESINVLKGSAASALYGSRGQNGVIMITTKSGKAGKKSFSVDINTGVTFEKVAILPKLQRSYGGGYGFEEVTVDGQTYQAVEYGVDESWGPKYEGQDVLHWWGIADYEQGITSSPQTAPWVAPKNDVDEFFETGVQYQNSVSITTSNENSALRIGYTNLNTTGTVPNSSQNKNTFNLNGNSSLFDGLVEVNATMTYVDTYTKGRPVSGYDDRSFSQKFFQWGQRQLDMDKLSDYKNPDGTQRTWNRNSISDPTPHYADNPYWIVYENYSEDTRKRLYGTTGLKFNLTDDLNVQGNVYMDTYTYNQSERIAPGSQALSYYDMWTRQFMEVNYEGKINYKKNLSDFSIVASIGANKRTEDYSSTYSGTDGGLAVGGLWNVSNSNNLALTSNFMRKKVVNSWFGLASVGWKNMAYLDITARKDYDTSLPTNNNSYFYPAASLSFIVSELLPEVNWLQNAKLRMNYAQTGNGTDPYRVYQTYDIGTSFGGYRQFTNSRQLNNPDLKAEKTDEIEFGLEASFLNNRLFVDFSYYKRNTKDQIVPIEISGASGFTSKVINAGEIENKGVELMIGGTIVDVSDFTWDMTVNYSKNKNKVVSLPDGLDKLQIGAAPFGGAYLNASVGDPFQMLWGYDYEYDQNGKKVISEGSGFYTNGGLKPIGSVLPDYNMGIRNVFKYKNFDFSALIDIQKGGKFYSLTHMWGMYSGMMAETATATSGGNTIREDGLVLDGVIATERDAEGNVIASRPNDVNIDAYDYAAYHYHGYGTPSATSFFDASFIKLREITLGYTLPQFSSVIRNMRVSVYGRNLATWGLDNKGMDPEAVVNGSGNIQGMEGGIIPSTSSFGMNLQVTF